MTYLLDPGEWAPFAIAVVVAFPVCWAGVYTGQLLVWAGETAVWHYRRRRAARRRS